MTMQEAKYGIYRDGLGFRNFKNFDGVRFAFKGVRTGNYLSFLTMFYNLYRNAIQ